MSDPRIYIKQPKYPRLAMFKARMRYRLVQFRRLFPYLVWHGDEVDVGVTFMQAKLAPNSTVDEAFSAFYSGELHDVERRLMSMGIEFDTGIGFDGRDWEWDFSLSGPISVRFRSRSRNPERRRERPKPRLVVSDSGAAVK